MYVSQLRPTLAELILEMSHSDSPMVFWLQTCLASWLGVFLAGRFGVKFGREFAWLRGAVFRSCLSVWYVGTYVRNTFGWWSPRRHTTNSKVSTLKTIYVSKVIPSSSVQIDSNGVHFDFLGV